MRRGLALSAVSMTFRLQNYICLTFAWCSLMWLVLCCTLPGIPSLSVREHACACCLALPGESLLGLARTCYLAVQQQSQAILTGAAGDSASHAILPLGSCMTVQCSLLTYLAGSKQHSRVTLALQHQFRDSPACLHVEKYKRGCTFTSSIAKEES